MRKIYVSDITLKALAEDRYVALLFREKTAIAACADSIGADAVELAPIKSVREDTIIYKTIAKNVQKAAVAIPVGFDVDGVNNAWECVKEANHPRLQIELPTSTVQMEYVYHVKGEKMLARISELVKAAKALCEDVEFSALDATRADDDFIIAAAKEAVASGATCVTVCDDAGIFMPEQIAALAAKIKAEVSVPVYVRVSDAINMAVACAVAAASAGVDGVKASMAGANVLSTGKLADAINVCGPTLGVCTELNNTKLHASIDDMLASINRDADYEDAEISDKKKILLDSTSTIAQVAQSAKVLGYDLSEIDCGNVHKALMQVCEKKDSLGYKELDALIASTAMQAPSTYHLENYTTTSSNATGAMTQITLKCNGDIIRGVSVGEGPIDSAFRAIEQCVGYHYELDDFQVQSVTEGKEALGSAVVRLRSNGRLFSGNGTSTDIVAASIRAYVNALNKIVYEEE